jgi:hypothetical protein
MKVNPRVCLATLLLCAAAPVRVMGQQEVKLEALFYLTYTAGEVDGKDVSRYSIGRSYLTARLAVLPRLSGRITLDSHQDGTGDQKVRLKYVYAKYDLGDYGLVRGLGVEGGMVHTAWLDYEEHVNLYRMRDPMFMERSGLFNSADFGVTITAGLGEPLSEEYRQRVTADYADRYGSFAFGIYNGGGYHAEEANESKVIQGRLTLRPLPDALPGFQLSGLAIVGEGNREVPTGNPDWRNYNLLASYQHAHGTLTAQYAWGVGNQTGSWFEPDQPSDATSFDGWALFGEGRFGSGWRIIAGYDHFERTPGGTDLGFDRVHAGIGYDLGDHNVLLLDWDRRQPTNETLSVDTRYRVVMQVKL